jgi:hypothetical protein
MRPFLPLILAVGLLSACTLAVPQPVPQADLTSCHAVGLEGLVGAPVRLLPANGAWSALRIIRPGEMVTMDYSPTRLNVRVNTMDIILSLNCG